MALLFFLLWGPGPNGHAQLLPMDWRIYDNLVPHVTPDHPYTEICYKKGGIIVDIHSEIESTERGFCRPGDKGFIIEKYQRWQTSWAKAQLECLRHGMRLPNPFEWERACEHAEEWAINGMKDEWASNEKFPLEKNGIRGTATIAFRSSGCNDIEFPWTAMEVGFANERAFRCAL